MAESTYEGWTIRLTKDTHDKLFSWVANVYEPGVYNESEWYRSVWLGVAQTRRGALRRAKREIRGRVHPTTLPEIIRL